MFGLSPWEILVVLIIAVLLFGKRLPEIGSSLGKAITNFKNSSKNHHLIMIVIKLIIRKLVVLLKVKL